MKDMRRYRSGAMLLALLAALLSIALGARGAAAEEIGVTSDAIKIGIFAPFTGSVANWGYPIARGALAVYEEMNAKGGIHGRKIVVVEEDDQCDPSKGVAAVKKLIHSHKVFMLHGANCSNAALAVRPEVQQTKVPWLVMGSTNIGIYLPTDPYIFGVMMTSDIEGTLLADFAMTVPNAKRIAVLTHRDAWGLGKYEPVINRLKERYQVTPAADETMDRGANDSTPQTLRLKAANPDAVIVILYPKEGAVFLRDALKYGLGPVFVGNGALEDIPDLVSKTGTDAAVKTLYSVTQLRHPLDGPEFAPLLGKLKARYPGTAISSFLPVAFAGAEAVVEALRRSGRDLTREKFVKELERIRGFETTMLAGSLEFSPTDHRGSRSANFVVYKDGKLAILGQKYAPIR